MKYNRPLLFSIITAVLIALSSPSIILPQQTQIEFHLNHVNIAVPDVMKAREYFADNLGFKVKLGRHHSNSVENAHIKFVDKSSVELISASIPIDGMAAWYIEYTKKYPGGAGAYVALEIPRVEQMDAFEERLKSAGILYTREEYDYAETIYFTPPEILSPLFFIRYKTPLQEPQILYNHLNSAYSLSSAWINTQDMQAMLDRLRLIGFTPYPTNDVKAPVKSQYKIKLGNKAMYIVNMGGGKNVAGITLLARNLQVVKSSTTLDSSQVMEMRGELSGSCVLIPPESGYGMWISFMRYTGQ